MLLFLEDISKKDYCIFTLKQVGLCLSYILKGRPDQESSNSIQCIKQNGICKVKYLLDSKQQNTTEDNMLSSSYQHSSMVYIFGYYYLDFDPTFQYA